MYRKTEGLTTILSNPEGPILIGVQRYSSDHLYDLGETKKVDETAH